MTEAEVRARYEQAFFAALDGAAANESDREAHDAYVHSMARIMDAIAEEGYAVRLVTEVGLRLRSMDLAPLGSVAQKEPGNPNFRRIG